MVKIKLIFFIGIVSRRKEQNLVSAYVGGENKKLES